MQCLYSLALQFQIAFVHDIVARSRVIMETLMATVVFIPLSILIVGASFSAPVYPNSILSDVAGSHSYRNVHEQGHQQRPTQDDDFTGRPGHSIPVTVVVS